MSKPKTYHDAVTEAARIGHSPRTLAQWRWLGTGPPFFGGGRGAKVLYDPELTDAWLETRKRHSTSDPGPARASA